MSKYTTQRKVSKIDEAHSLNYLAQYVFSSKQYVYKYGSLILRGGNPILTTTANIFCLSQQKNVPEKKNLPQWAAGIGYLGKK